MKLFWEDAKEGCGYMLPDQSSLKSMYPHLVILVTHIWLSAGERSCMLANKPGASLGLEHLGPTASAISSRNWSSWLREKFVPEEGR